MASPSHSTLVSAAAAHDRVRWLPLVVACVMAGVAVGMAAALVNPLILIGLVIAAPVALWLIGAVNHAVVALVVVIALLPRFALPVRLGFTPTFLDLALIGLLAAWLMHQMGARRDLPLRQTAVAIPILALTLVAVGTFIIGLPNGALTPLVLRRFFELVLSVLMVLVIVAILPDLASQERFVKLAVLVGAASALIGIALYVMPDELAIRALSTLRPFGYPAGPDVLRFIRDDPALMQRATGLWIDPNAFGGYLLVTGALAVPQLFSRQPVMRRWLVALCLASIGLALVLTVSRAAMLGLAVVAVLMGLLKYHRLLALLALVLIGALILPQTRELVQHFIEGFQGRDLATQMRFGEYKDAFRLIERYPLFGVGFVGTPDVDLYIGVSSMYLLIAQQMGMLGLLAFAAVLIVLFAGAVRAWPAVSRHDRACAVFLGAHGAVVGASFTGIFDHYFFNIDFHNAVILFWMMVALAAASQRLVSPAADGSRDDRQIPEAQRSQG